MTDRTDIDAHFHRCRTVEDIDFAALELGLVASQSMGRLLRRMFS